MGLGARLGWTGWMAPNWSKADQHWRADARFHLVSRRGARLLRGRSPMSTNRHCERSEATQRAGRQTGRSTVRGAFRHIASDQASPKRGLLRFARNDERRSSENRSLTWARTSASNRSPASSIGSATKRSSKPCGRPKAQGNRNIELAHWLLHLLQKDRADLALTADHFKLDRARMIADTTRVVGGLAQERNRNARHFDASRRRARSRLALRHPAVRRDANPHRASAGRAR